MNLWQKLQDDCWNNYLTTQSYKGAFSVEGLRGAELVGNLINKMIPGGVCLDIGCGIMPKPYYMEIACEVEFIGIDPLKGDKQRDFDFFNGVAECLPYFDNSFDGVLFATSLDHVIDVNKSISEAKRVLKKDGYLFLWTAIKDNNAKYRVWLNKPKPAQYDDFHLQAFTDSSIRKLFSDLKFIERIRVNRINNESIYYFQK